MKLKKLGLSLLAVACLGTSAMALDTDGMYIGSALAIENSDDSFDAGMALIVTGGMPLYENQEQFLGALFAEVELAQTIMPHTWEGYSVKHEVTFTSASGFVAWKYDINEDWYVKPRLGLTYGKTKLESSTPFGDSSYSDSEFSMDWSLLGGYKINKEWDATFGWYNVDGFLDAYYSFGAGINYKF